MYLVKFSNWNHVEQEYVHIHRTFSTLSKMKEFLRDYNKGEKSENLKFKGYSSITSKTLEKCLFATNEIQVTFYNVYPYMRNHVEEALNDLKTTFEAFCENMDWSHEEKLKVAGKNYRAIVVIDKYTKGEAIELKRAYDFWLKYGSIHFSVLEHACHFLLNRINSSMFMWLDYKAI